MLVRNYNEEIGASVAEAFGTEDRGAVESYCRANAIEFEWQPDGGLRTWQRRSAVVRHPVTGRRCWFNQIAFLNEWTLDPEVREFLVDTYGADGLPFTTRFGGGDPIGEDVVQLINEVYKAKTRREPWQAGDLMLVDNIRCAHSREPFTGPREVLVGMADPVRLADCSPTVKVNAGCHSLVRPCAPTWTLARVEPGGRKEQKESPNAHPVAGPGCEVRPTQPGAPALTARTTTISYADLHERTELAAAGLRDLGLEGGERVAVFLDKRIETVVALLGLLAGRWRVRPGESRAAGQAGQAHPRRLRRTGTGDLHGPAAGSARASSLPASRSPTSSCWATRSSRTRTPYRVLPWADRRAREPRPRVLRRAASTRMWPQSSTRRGAPGRPKGVVLSHRNLVVGAESVSTYLDNTAEDRILAVLPLSFDAGLSQLTTGFCVGAHVVLADYLLPGDVVRLCARTTSPGWWAYRRCGSSSRPRRGRPRPWPGCATSPTPGGDFRESPCNDCARSSRPPRRT